MRLLQLLISKVNDWLDPVLSLIGRGSHAEQVLLVNLCHKVLRANDAALPEAIAEFTQHLENARLNKLVFESSGESSPLLLQCIEAAQKKPVLWPVLQNVAQRKFRLPLDWNILEDKEQENSPSALGKLVSLAFQDDQNSEETYRGAQELLLILVNSHLYLDWNACVDKESNDNALWALTIAANNGQPWAVAMLLLVIKKFNQTLNWDVNFSDNPAEQDTALSLVTDLALKGSPQYLEAIFSNEVVFSKLNLNAKVEKSSLVDALLEKPHCAHLARWILLAGKDIDEKLLGEKGKSLLHALRFKLKEISRKLWLFEQAGFMPEGRFDKPGTFSPDEAKQRIASSLLPRFARLELAQELMRIPYQSQEGIIQLAISQGKFNWQPTDVEIKTQKREKDKLERTYQERSHYNTAVLATKALYHNQPVQDVMSMLGNVQSDTPRQLLRASKEHCRDTIRAALDELTASGDLPSFLNAPLRKRIIQAVSIVPLKGFTKAGVEKSIQTEIMQHNTAQLASAHMMRSQSLVFSTRGTSVKMQEREEACYKEIRTAISHLIETNILPPVLNEAQSQQMVDAIGSLPSNKCTKAAVESKIRGIRF